MCCLVRAVNLVLSALVLVHWEGLCGDFSPEGKRRDSRRRLLFLKRKIRGIAMGCPFCSLVCCGCCCAVACGGVCAVCGFFL